MKKPAKSPAAIAIGKRIKEARKDAGFDTQAELARACNWLNADGEPSQSRVSNYESGQREPNAEDLMTIVTITGKGVEFFFKDLNRLAAGEPSTPETTATGVREQTLRRWSTLLSQMTPADQKVIQDHAELLIRARGHK